MLGPDWPPPSPEELKQLRRIVAKRRLLWSLAGATLPVFYFASLFPEMDPSTVGRVWIAGVGAALVWHNLSACPRCGERFNVRLFWGMPSAERCRHCGFRLRPPPLARE